MIDESSSATSARRRSRPRRYRSSKVRRPIGSASRGSACARAGREAEARRGRDGCETAVAGATGAVACPAAAGRDAIRTPPGPGGEPVGMTVVSSASWCSRATTKTSMRCGNGNAGASTSIEARKPALPRPAERRSTRHPGLPTSRPWMGRPLPSVPQREAGQVDVDAGGPVVARPQPVRPRRQQRESQRRPGPQCR